MASRPVSFVKVTFFFSFFIFFGIDTITQFGLVTGSHIMLLLWSFWTLCLPLFGSGLLLAPFFELFTEVSDYTLEFFAWITSLGIVSGTLLLAPQRFDATAITHLLSWIVTHPYPYWIILITAFLPICAQWLHEKHKIPRGRLAAAHLNFLLIAISLGTFGYITLNDLIIISNIYS